jgi:fatty-acyl-CoA synthase
MNSEFDIKLSDRTLGDWLEYWAKESPDKEYIVYSDRDLRFTWKKFNDRVDNMAKGLISIGVTRGSNVGIWAQNVPDWLTFLYATAKIGAVAVTVNTSYRLDEIDYLMKNSDMHTLCMTDGVAGSCYTDIIYELIPELKSHHSATL